MPFYVVEGSNGPDGSNRDHFLFLNSHIYGYKKILTTYFLSTLFDNTGSTMFNIQFVVIVISDQQTTVFVSPLRHFEDK